MTIIWRLEKLPLSWSPWVIISIKALNKQISIWVEYTKIGGKVTKWDDYKSVIRQQQIS